MMRRNIKILVLCMLVLSMTSGLSFAQQELNRPISIGSLGRRVVYNTKGLKPVAHKELMSILEQEEKGPDTQELIDRFRQFPREQKLETVIYCLKENKYADIIVLKIATESPLHDKCFVPYLVEIIPKLKGRTMMMVARAAQMIPDVNLMEPLLNFVVESDYEERIYWSNGRINDITNMSAFEEAGMAIDRITNGRMGRIDLTKPKETVIQEWRDIWPYVKKEMLKEKEEKEREIRPVAHQKILDIFAKANKVVDKSEYSGAFDNFEFNDMLETIAYLLEKGPNPDSFFFFCMRQDKRLVPFIARAIKDPNDIKVLCAARLAEENPDPNLLPLLMKYGLDNDYGKNFRYGSEGNYVIYHSVFGWASEAINKITNGKIGTSKYSSVRKEIPEEEKHALIEQWRKIYDETLKKDYEKN